MATYAIGDIQGCFVTFLRLLERISFDPAHDRLWLVGDLVNRGPRSVETLRFVRNLGKSAVTILGNHDLALLIIAQGYGQQSKWDRFDEILSAPDIADLLLWLRHLPLCHAENGYCMVHSGLLPAWTVEQAVALAAEVEAAMIAPNWSAFLGSVWGNEPAFWRDDLAGWDRLRVIINAMTRMRFCSPEGVIDFEAKGEVVSAPPGFVPWFEVPDRCSADTVLVTGHWSALGLKILPNLLAIDSGCLWGGGLTAIRLEDRCVFQVPTAADEIQSF